MDWFKTHGWKGNPFTFIISPSLFVGYSEQSEKVLNLIEQKHKILFLTGPTGSGKTTFLKWLEIEISKMPNFEVVYIPKPPKKPEEFVHILNERFRPFFRKIKNVHQIPKFLSKRKNHVIFLCDEIHEANIEVLEWIRVLSDQINNLSLVLAGLPIFEERLKERLETLRKRIVAKTELLSLTKEECREMIRRRIENINGHGIEPFTEEIIDKIYEQSGGFPREVLRLCNDLVNKAISLNVEKITIELLQEVEKKEKIGLEAIESLPKMQKNILEILIEPMTTGEIANKLDLQKYKSRQHAVRSVNNILKRLINDGYVDRSKEGRFYRYTLKPEVKTIFINK